MGVVLLLAPVLAGCVMGTRRETHESLELYHVVLHPVNVTWEPENRTLSGNFTISNIPPPNLERAKEEVELDNVGIRILYYAKPPPASYGDRVAEWILEYEVFQEVVIENDETWVFNYSVTPQESAGHVEGVAIDVSYHYEAQLVGGPERGEDVRVTYLNKCLLVQGGGLVQYTDQGEYCKPSRFGNPNDRNTDYRTTIHRADIRPIDEWFEWRDPWEELVPTIEYLESFRYNEADVTYFEGEIFGDDQ